MVQIRGLLANSFDNYVIDTYTFPLAYSLSLACKIVNFVSKRVLIAYNWNRKVLLFSYSYPLRKC